MAGSNRVWATLTDEESAALEAAAKARGLRPGELVRAAILGFLNAPQDSPSLISPGLDAALVRLEGVAEKLEQTATSTRIALDMAYASEAERGDIRGALTDIAMSIGVLAGSIEPMATDAPGAGGDAIGSDTWRKNFG